MNWRHRRSDLCRFLFYLGTFRRHVGGRYTTKTAGGDVLYTRDTLARPSAYGSISGTTNGTTVISLTQSPFTPPCRVDSASSILAG